MLINSRDVLRKAKKEGYAIPAPDFLDLDSARTFVQVAEEIQKPVILSYAQVHSNIISLEEAAAVGKVVGESVKVPVVLHLDHGEDADFIKRAIELGFTSVMIDASMEDFDENVRRTKEIVEMAHPKDITVEAEIGHVGQGCNYNDYGDTDSVYTTVEEAAEFVRQTGVDSLAVSIGTAHGVYKGSGVPVLNFDRLHELRDALDIPLVLHGSSGSGDDNIRRCAREGISKLNVFTDFLIGAMDEIEEESPKDFVKMKQVCNRGMENVLKHYFEMLSL